MTVVKTKMDTREIRDLKYIDVVDVAAHGATNSFGIKLSVAATGFELSEEAKNHIQNVGRELENWLEVQAVAADPEMREASAKERKQLLELFSPLLIWSRPIPNEYCRQPCCSQKPWYIVYTPIGPIKIGWRKRVIVINWQETDQKKDLFPNEPVTMHDRMIHAYGYEDARKYLDVILSRKSLVLTDDWTRL